MQHYNCTLFVDILAGRDVFDSTTIDQPFVPFKLPDDVSVKGLRVGIPRVIHLAFIHIHSFVHSHSLATIVGKSVRSMKSGSKQVLIKISIFFVFTAVFFCFLDLTSVALNEKVHAC